MELPLTAENVESVLDEVRPYLMADGGNVELHEIDGNVVRLKLQGACGSCPSSVTTMKMGIERRLMEKIPDIVAVEPIMDEVIGLELNEENIEKVKFTNHNYELLPLVCKFPHFIHRFICSEGIHFFCSLFKYFSIDVTIVSLYGNTIGNSAGYYCIFNGSYN